MEIVGSTAGKGCKLAVRLCPCGVQGQRCPATPGGDAGGKQEGVNSVPRAGHIASPGAEGQPGPGLCLEPGGQAGASPPMHKVIKSTGGARSVAVAAMHPSGQEPWDSRGTRSFGHWLLDAILRVTAGLCELSRCRRGRRSIWTFGFLRDFGSLCVLRRLCVLRSLGVLHGLG